MISTCDCRDPRRLLDFGEDLDSLVERYIWGAFEAMATLEHDMSTLIPSGTATFSANLTGIGDDKPVSRGVEIWGFRPNSFTCRRGELLVYLVTSPHDQ